MLKFSLLLAHPIYTQVGASSFPEPPGIEAQVGSADLILHVRLLESHRYSIGKKLLAQSCFQYLEGIKFMCFSKWNK